MLVYQRVPGYGKNLWQFKTDQNASFVDEIN